MTTGWSSSDFRVDSLMSLPDKGVSRLELAKALLSAKWSSVADES